MLAFDLTFSAPKSVSLLWALGFGAGGRGGGGGAPGGGGGGVGVFGGAGRAGPGAVAGGAPAGGALGVGWWRGSCIGRAGRAILSCIRIVWCRTWCSGPGTAGMWPSMRGRCSSGPGRPGRSTRTTCSGPCRASWGWCGGRTGTTPGRWRASPGPSCGRSPSAAPRSRPSSKPRGRCMSRRRCGCRPMTRRRWPPGRPRITR